MSPETERLIERGDLAIAEGLKARVKLLDLRRRVREQVAWSRRAKGCAAAAWEPVPPRGRAP